MLADGQWPLEKLYPIYTKVVPYLVRVKINSLFLTIVWSMFYTVAGPVLQRNHIVLSHSISLSLCTFVARP